MEKTMRQTQAEFIKARSQDQREENQEEAQAYRWLINTIGIDPIADPDTFFDRYNEMSTAQIKAGLQGELS